MAIQAINTLKNWFKTGLKPTQSQFWDWLDSFRHKSDKVPVADIEGIDDLLLAKASQDVVEGLDIRVSKIENPDRVLRFGTIQLTGLNVTIAYSAFAWVVNKIEHLTPLAFAETLDSATLFRVDVVVGNSTGGYNIIKGDESATSGGATEKAPPAGTIRLGYILLQGNTVIGSGSAPAEEKANIIDNDRIVFDNSQNSYAKASIKLSNFKTVIKAWLDSFFKDKYVIVVDNVTTAYTLKLTDGTKNSLIRHNNAAAITETIPTNASVAFPIGTEIKSISIGVGLRTVVGAGGVTILNHISLTSAQNQMMRFIKTAVNTWIVTGDVGFEKDIKLTNYPNTRNDGQIPTNRILSTDVSGNLKMYTIAMAPPPYMEVLIPDSTLPSTTTNFTIKGAFFTPTMTVAIVGQTINYITFVSDNLIKVNVTTGATEGSYAVTLNNGLSATFPNALLIVLGTIFTPLTAEWEAPTGNVSAIDDSVKVNLYESVGSNRWNKQFDYTRNFRVSFKVAKTPFGNTYNNEHHMEHIALVKVSDNSPLFVFNVRKENASLVSNNTYSTATNWSSNLLIGVLDDTVNRFYEFRYVSGVMYFFVDGVLKKTFTDIITGNLKLRISTKTLDFINIKYVETA